MGLRFNPPPGWPLPDGFAPPPGWQPDPSWPPAPPGWSLWLSDDAAGKTQIVASPVQSPRYIDQGFRAQEHQDRGSQDRGSQDLGSQDRGYQDGGYQDQGYQGGGYQESGYQAGGYQGSGYPDQGYQGSGYPDQGGASQGGASQGGAGQGGAGQGGANQGGGYQGTEYQGSGYPDQGYQGSGYPDQGYQRQEYAGQYPDQGQPQYQGQQYQGQAGQAGQQDEAGQQGQGYQGYQGTRTRGTRTRDQDQGQQYQGQDYQGYQGQGPGQGYQDQPGQGYQDQANQGQAYHPYQAYTYGQQPPKQTINGLAITSFILGLIGGTILSLIFGIVGLVQIRKRGQRGRGFAIAGMILAVIWIGVAVALVLNGTLSFNKQPSTTGVTKPGRINIFALRVGDCFQNPPPSQSALGVTDVSVVPCTTAHNAQVFAQFDATNHSYPGSAALIKEAQTGCQSRISANVNRSKITSTMTLRFLYPEPQSWTNGRRLITCLIVDSSKDLRSTVLSH